MADVAVSAMRRLMTTARNYLRLETLHAVNDVMKQRDRDPPGVSPLRYPGQYAF